MLAALERLRAKGWKVAVHNDYVMDGLAYTFWLLTHPNGHWIKGEGATDEDALARAETQLEKNLVSHGARRLKWQRRGALEKSRELVTWLRQVESRVKNQIASGAIERSPEFTEGMITGCLQAADAIEREYVNTQ